MPIKEFLGAEKLEPTKGYESVLLSSLVVVVEHVSFHGSYFSTRPDVRLQWQSMTAPPRPAIVPYFPLILASNSSIRSARSLSPPAVCTSSRSRISTVSSYVC